MLSSSTEPLVDVSADPTPMVDNLFRVVDRFGYWVLVAVGMWMLYNLIGRWIDRRGR